MRPRLLCWARVGRRPDPHSRTNQAWRPHRPPPCTPLGQRPVAGWPAVTATAGTDYSMAARHSTDITCSIWDPASKWAKMRVDVAGNVLFIIRLPFSPYRWGIYFNQIQYIPRYRLIYHFKCVTWVYKIYSWSQWIFTSIWLKTNFSCVILQLFWKWRLPDVCRNFWQS